MSAPRPLPPPTQHTLLPLSSTTQILLKSPVLLESQLESIQGDSSLGTKTFRLSFPAGERGALEAALKKLCADVEAAVEGGCTCVVLSDRPEGGAGVMDAARVPIPSLLAVGAVHHHLIKTYLRTSTSIVVDTAQVRGRMPMFPPSAQQGGGGRRIVEWHPLVWVVGECLCSADCTATRSRKHVPLSRRAGLQHAPHGDAGGLWRARGLPLPGL